MKGTLSRCVVVALGLLLLAGCGGGGGGGGGDTQGGITYVGNTNPAVITATNASRLVANIVGSGDASGVIVGPAVATASISQGARDSSSQSGLVHRLNTYQHETLTRARGRPSGSRVSVAAILVDDTVPCDGGSIRYSGTLNDNGTGTLTVTYSDCRSGDDTLNGVATLRIDAFDLTFLVSTDSTFSFSILTLTSPTTNESVSGSMRDQVNIATNTETLTVNMVTRDNMSSEMAKAENLIVVDVYNNLFFPSSYTETITGRMFDSVHGYVDVTTVVPLVFSSINQLFPGNGQLLFTGAASARIRVTTLSAVLVKVELDLDGNSVYETAATLKWTDLGGPVGADLGDADADGMHNSWETANGLNLSNAADAALDKDNDGFTNLQEYLVGTDPSNAGSIPPSADLAITMTDAPDPVAIGGTFSYSITVVNWGPAAAPDVVVTDVLPAGLNLVSVTTSLGACTGTSTVTCNLGTLALGWSATINLSVTASTAGLYNNTASVVSSAAEGNSTNNSATATTTVGSSAGSLQSLIDVAGPGDTVLVPSGLYVGGIDFNSKNITLASISGSASTILHGNNGTAVRMGPGGTIRGFTITGANASFGAGIEVIGSGSVISRNIFDGNMQSAGGFGAAIGGNSASPMIERNIFRNNGCDTQFLSGVVAFVNGSSPTIVNNLFVNNPCRGINLSLPQGNTPQIMNNTFVGNSVAIRVDRRVSQITQTYRNNILFQNGIGLEVEFGSESDNPVWGNNLVFSNTTNYQGIANPTGLNSNISANPLFVSASAVDYHLLAGSPAIDAGSTLGAPSIDFDGTSRPLDGNGDSTPSFDIGAFEFSP